MKWDWLERCMTMENEGTRQKERQETWWRCVTGNMKSFGLSHQWRSKALRCPGSTVSYGLTVARLEGPKLEGLSRGEVLGRDSEPPAHQIVGLGSTVSSPRGVCRRSPSRR